MGCLTETHSLLENAQVLDSTSPAHAPRIESLPLENVRTAAARSVDQWREDCVRRLLLRYRQADAWAGERLVDRLSPIMAGYLYQFHVPRSEREDLLQDCWIRLHNSCMSYRETEAVLPWVYGVVRNTQMDAYRKRQRRRAREVAVERLPEPARALQAPLSASLAMDAEVMPLLARLPKSQRRVLLMMKVEGMSVPEVAAALGSSEGSVKQKAHRAYAKLREWVERPA